MLTFLAIALVILTIYRIWGADIFLLALPRAERERIKLMRADEFKKLEDFHSRLSSVTSGLLQKADEIDRESKFFGEVSSHWSRSFTNSCQRAVLLADRMGLIGHHLHKRNVKIVRAELLNTCHAAHQLDEDLKQLKMLAGDAPKIEGSRGRT